MADPGQLLRVLFPVTRFLTTATETKLDMDSTVLVGALLNEFRSFGHYARVGITPCSSLELLVFVLATYCFRYHRKQSPTFLSSFPRYSRFPSPVARWHTEVGMKSRTISLSRFPSCA